MPAHNLTTRCELRFMKRNGYSWRRRKRDEGGETVFASEWTVYSAPGAGRGGSAVYRAITDVRRAKHVVIRLFWRDFRANFKQKILGYVWALLTPLMGALTFIILYFAGILRPGTTEIPYPLYALIGTTIWGALTSTVAVTAGSLQSQADLLLRTQVPKLAMFTASVGTVLYGIATSMITLLIVFLLFSTRPSMWFLLYPLLVSPIVLLGLGIGLILASTSVIAKDLTVLASQFLAVLMFLTPAVLVPAVTNDLLSLVMKWNPLSYLIEVPRNLITGQGAGNLPVYLLVAALSLLFIPVALRVFYALEGLVAERL